MKQENAAKFRSKEQSVLPEAQKKACLLPAKTASLVVALMFHFMRFEFVSTKQNPPVGCHAFR
jgi:hypothetical protein